MLKLHEVKVWVLRDQDLNQYKTAVDKLKTLLHFTEVSELAKRLIPIKRERSLGARYMIWRTLGAQLGVNWESLGELEKNPPRCHDRNFQNIFWSITHTKGLTMVALTLNQRVGIDVEFLSTKRDVLKIAERYFEEEEKALLISSSPYLTEENFFRMWTTKEAHYKYLGFGNSYNFLRRSCLYLQSEKDVWGLKWERDFFFTVVTDKHPESNLEVKPFSEKLFDGLGA